jgi:hypothetical protein
LKLLTGKYNDGIPTGSRFEKQSKANGVENRIRELNSPEGKAKVEKVRQLTKMYALQSSQSLVATERRLGVFC